MKVTRCQFSRPRPQEASVLLYSSCSSAQASLLNGKTCNRAESAHLLQVVLQYMRGPIQDQQTTSS